MTMGKIEAVAFKNKRSQTLRGFVHVPTSKKNLTAVIFLHGFPGSMFNTAFRMCRGLCQLGYLSLRFEFSGTNTSDGKFEDKLMSQEIKEIKYAVDFLAKNYSAKKVVLVGHSTGAIDAALYAHTDKRVSKLVVLGAVCNLNNAVRYDFTDTQVRDFWMKGHIIYRNPESWYHGKKLKKKFYDEFFTLNIPQAIKKYRRPLLIIHGQNDEAIPLSEPRQLFEIARRPKKLVIIKGAGHRLSGRKHLNTAVRRIDRFIRG